MSIVAEVHVGDVGTVFRATVKDGDVIVDVSAASTKQLIFRKPDGTLLTQDADFTDDGTDGQIEYITVDASPSELDVPGSWWVQGYVVLPSGTWHTDKFWFDVSANLGVTWPR